MDIQGRCSNLPSAACVTSVHIEKEPYQIDHDPAHTNTTTTPMGGHLLRLATPTSSSNGLSVVAVTQQ